MNDQKIDPIFDRQILDNGDEVEIPMVAYSLFYKKDGRRRRKQIEDFTDEELKSIGLKMMFKLRHRTNSIRIRKTLEEIEGRKALRK